MALKRSDRRRARGRRWRWLLYAAVLAGAAWLAGLVWFAQSLPRASPTDTRRTDALVVLTGGSARVATGLALLAEGRADKLFVSGVYQGVDVQELLRVSRLAPGDLQCCIVLGYAAGNTRGNAAETAAWMRAQGYRSLRLITANYHMPRSLLEFRRALPEVEIVPHPVVPETVRLARWWRWRGTASLIALEYTKYLVALVRSWLTAPLHDPGLVP